MGFVKKEEVLGHVGGKALFFGEQGSGKSTLMGTFPRINLVDSEDGNTYYLKKNKNILAVMRTISANEVQETLDELNDADAVADFDTIAIDSGTKLYENMQAACFEIATKRAKKQKMKGKDVDLQDVNLAQRDWGSIKRLNQKMATSYILLSSLGKWVVCVAHQKDLFADQSKEEIATNTPRVKVGEGADLAKGADYDYDIVGQTFTKTDDEGNVHYFLRILKDRTGATKKGQIIENPTFDNLWRPVWESTLDLDTKPVNMSNGLSKDIEKLQEEEDNVDELVNSIKESLLGATTENKILIAKKITELGIKSQSLPNNDPALLKQLVDFIATLK